MKTVQHRWMAAAGAVCLAVTAQSFAADAKAPEAKPASNYVIAKAGTLEVQRGEVENMLNSLPPQARAEIKANRPAAERLVRSQLADKAVLQQAQTQNWAQRPEVKAQIDAATKEIVFRSYLASVSAVPADYPSDKELQAVYDQTKGQMVKPAQYRVAQIFIPAPANDAKAVAEARKSAADIAKEAQNPKANFTALMKKYSKDPSAQAGGDTGLIPLGQLLPEMRPVVGKLKKGDVSAPVQSGQGFHVLKLVDMTPQGTPTLAEVRDSLRNAMRQKRQQDTAAAYLQGLLNNQTVTVDGPALNAVVDSVIR
ncbi:MULTISPECIES: peptidylprolyl isomerase [unclassified Achromobacter]|uniref:peptidylprolyl isomerase n=1 Tax=unclassified Achromobacter TaxID=2626865 RepID=UPI000B51E14E|nr:MULTISPECIES: peptidylprolyl isomerase [unclassified Achromobacter]OWT71507.1 peptidylprolyl isomerase [Achromobacter sp. HZ34]OWT73164.1 peptidylprolyl isomerase [Achromobacter sp. HZ28]